MNDTMITSPGERRAGMVDRILAARPGLSARVAEVMRQVPRHRFVPEASVADAYAERAVITKRAADGVALSCASEPGIVAMMLDQLDVRPGHRVLEIGAGTGYNAALVAELTGPTGQVTTVDIDPEVTAGARAHLDTTGYQRVVVSTHDGRLGEAERAPYDRMVLTVGAWDIPPAWWDQLATGRRLVVPLRWRGQTRSIGFTHAEGRLTSDSVELCGFVPMVGQDGERDGAIDPGGLVRLYWDIDQPINPAALTGALDQPRSDAWSGVMVGGEEPFDGIWLRLSATEPGTCRLAAEKAAIDTSLRDPIVPIRTPALAVDASLAYLTLRRAGDEERPWELGAIGHGPAGRDLADRLCAQVRTWDTDRTAQPGITAYPADTPTERRGDGLVIDKPNTRLLVTF